MCVIQIIYYSCRNVGNKNRQLKIKVRSANSNKIICSFVRRNLLNVNFKSSTKSCKTFFAYKIIVCLCAYYSNFTADVQIDSSLQPSITRELLYYLKISLRPITALVRPKKITRLFSSA